MKMAAEIPSGAPHNRDEEFALFMGGAGDEPSGAPQNREEEWLLWLQENAGGGGTPTITVTVTREIVEGEPVVTADKTYAEIAAVINAGGSVIWMINDGDEFMLPTISTVLSDYAYGDNPGVVAQGIDYYYQEDGDPFIDEISFFSYEIWKIIVLESDDVILVESQNAESIPHFLFASINWDIGTASYTCDVPYDDLVTAASWNGTNSHWLITHAVIDINGDSIEVPLVSTNFLAYGDPIVFSGSYYDSTNGESKSVSILVERDESVDVFVSSGGGGGGGLPDPTGKDIGDILTLDSHLDPVWESPTVAFNLAYDYFALYSDLMTLFQSWLTAAVQSPGSIVADNVTGTDYSAFITNVSDALYGNKRVYLVANLDNQDNFLPVINFASNSYITTRMMGVYAVQGLGDYMLSVDIQINNSNIFVSGYAIAV